MSDYCENCGSRVYHGNCVNCDEEVFIEEQQWRTEFDTSDKEYDRPEPPAVNTHV